jgi:hypothetical protein
MNWPALAQGQNADGIKAKLRQIIPEYQFPAD